MGSHCRAASSSGPRRSPETAAQTGSARRMCRNVAEMLQAHWMSRIKPRPWSITRDGCSDRVCKAEMLQAHWMSRIKPRPWSITRDGCSDKPCEIVKLYMHTKCQRNEAERQAVLTGRLCKAETYQVHKTSNIDGGHKWHCLN
eukprot:1156505-Pelagomonas_calceolata.AAC.9